MTDVHQAPVSSGEGKGTRTMALELYMLGLIVQDMGKSLEFYRRLGLAIPEGSKGQTHVQIKMGSGRVQQLCQLLLLLAVLAACGSGQGPSGSAAVSTPLATPTPTEPPVPRTTVSFRTADHLKLDGLLYHDGAKTAIICMHGLAGDKSEWVDAAPWFASRGYMVLAFDFRGYSASQGPYNANKLDLDLLAALAFVKSRGAQEVMLLGSSLGAKVALRVASYTPVAGVIGLSPGYSN